MPDRTYGTTEVIGSSTVSSDNAINNAICKATEILQQVNWFEVIESRGFIQDGHIAHFQVTVKIGYQM